jgi:hypothetical protein
VGLTKYWGNIAHPFTGEGAGLMIEGGFGTMAIYIIATIDAVRVAKVRGIFPTL